ncbi:MAG: general secretion pathway protein D [Arcobacteraceae bacterium]|jgi:general secretion pathway protein D
MKKVFIFLSILLIVTTVNSKELIDANFNNLTLTNIIKITSKIINKNILISANISGKVNFISNKPIYKSEVLDVLKTILKSNGFKIIENNNILNVVSIKKNDKIKVIYLKNTKASDIFEIIKNLDEKNNKSHKIRISVFQDTNAIVLKGSNNKISQFSKLINQLDILKQQVYVQARIIEVSERKTQNIGIEYGLNGFDTSGSGILTFSSTLNRKSISNALSLEQLSAYGYDPAHIKSGLALGATINLLKQNNALDIVSEPSILCLNNQESSIYVGETRSIPTGTTVGTTTTTNFQREDIGLKLIVKPRISDNNKVTLELKTILEDIKETDIRTGNPNTNKKEIITTVIVNNGESVILGGLIKNKLEKINSKVPLLGDIPYFGSLFRNSYEISDKINLVVIVTPYIIPKTKDLTFITDQLASLKMIENEYSKRFLKDLERKKAAQRILEESEVVTKDKLRHKQVLEEQFGL